MKKIFTLLMFVMATVSSAWADDDATITFVDAEGNVVKSGSVVTVNTYGKELDQDGNEVEASYFDSGIFLRLNSESGIEIQAVVSVATIDNGTLDEALTGRKNSSTEAHDYTTGYSSFYPDAPIRSLNLMWTPEDYGTCEVTLQVNVFKRNGIFPPFTYEKVEDGPTVTVRFVYSNDDSTGISTASADAQPVARYTLDGQMSTTTRPGLNIVRYSDGTTRKIFMK